MHLAAPILHYINNNNNNNDNATKEYDSSTKFLSRCVKDCDRDCFEKK